MTALEIIAQRGTDAVKKLRLEKLRNGLPFMINTDDLESNQCYLEYPDGIIKIVCLEKDAMAFKPLRVLSAIEAQVVRSENGLVYP